MFTEILVFLVAIVLFFDALFPARPSSDIRIEYEPTELDHCVRPRLVRTKKGC